MGVGLGLFQVWHSSPEFQAEKRVDAAVLVLLGVLLGSRMGFIASHPAYYAVHLLEIPQFWLGGLSWAGAIPGGLLALALIGMYQGVPPRKLADDLAPLVAPLAVFAWLAAWNAGSGYGPVLPVGTGWGLPTPDITGKIANRWPVQAAAALSLLLSFALVEYYGSRRGFPGRYFSLVGLVLSLNLLIFSWVVVEPAPLWRGLRQDSWAAMALALFFCGVLISTLGLKRKWKR